MGQTVNLLAYAFGGSNPSLPTKNCGSSSVDRALAFQAEGRGFEPRLPLLERIDNQKVINPFLLYEFFGTPFHYTINYVIVGLLLFPRNQCYMLTIKVKSFFYLVRGSIISLSLYKNYKLIVYLGHLENPD